MKVNSTFRKINKKRKNRKRSIKELRQWSFVDQNLLSRSDDIDQYEVGNFDRYDEDVDGGSDAAAEVLLDEDWKLDLEEEGEDAPEIQSTGHWLDEESFKKHMYDLGTIASLQETFNTRQSVTNTEAENLIYASKRASLAINRVYSFIVHALHGGAYTGEVLNVGAAVAYVLKNFNTFLPLYLSHLRLVLNRMPLTVKIVLHDIDQVLLRGFLLSEEADRLLNGTQVSVLLIESYINILSFLLCMY